MLPCSWKAVSADPDPARQLYFEFYTDTIRLQFDPSLCTDFTGPVGDKAIAQFYRSINSSNYTALVDALLQCKQQRQLDDWFYYQLVRRVAAELSPKAENYERYTLYKWFLMAKSGYDVTLAVGTHQQLLFYVSSNDNIYDIPYFTRDGKQYVCLNYHDYGKIDFSKEQLFESRIDIPEAKRPFSYRVTQVPDFKPEAYAEKEISFDYHQQTYQFKVKVNAQVQNIFANYPVVDFDAYFNIPMSRETYHSLIPILKGNVAQMSTKEGVDYLMHFTRYAFMYANDQDHFGKEKRLSPEQTLLYEQSDCDDRAALFFYLVKEVYNMPMIVLLYPTHVTIAVQFNKPVGHPVVYKGRKYSVCDPTPQETDLRIGQRTAAMRKNAYQVVYEYDPQR